MYCSVADVESYFLNKEFGCEGYLKNEEIQAFIAQEAAYINTVIGMKYSLTDPISNQTDLLILKMINEKLVAGTIDEILREKSEDGTLDRNRNLRKDARDWLDKISNGEWNLQTKGRGSLIKFNNVDSNGNAVSKYFRIGNTNSCGCNIDRENKCPIHIPSDS